MWRTPDRAPGTTVGRWFVTRAQISERSLPGSSPAGAVGLAGVPGDQDALIADGQQAGEWGGWGSNPRPADYEKYGLLQPVR